MLDNTGDPDVMSPLIELGSLLANSDSCKLQILRKSDVGHPSLVPISHAVIVIIQGFPKPKAPMYKIDLPAQIQRYTPIKIISIKIIVP